MADIATTYTLTTPGPDINFNVGDVGDGTDKYWLTSIRGLDMPQIRAPTDPVPFGDGLIKHTSWLSGLRPQFDGMFLIETPVDCMDRRNALFDDLKAALLSIVNTAGTLAWTPAGGAAESLSVYLEVALDTPYSDNYTVQNFSFGLVSEASSY